MYFYTLVIFVFQKSKAEPSTSGGSAVDKKTERLAKLRELQLRRVCLIFFSVHVF